MELIEPRGRKLHNADAARRMADIIALHQVALSRDELIAKRYAAIRLSDGGSDGMAYETRDDAMRHQLHPALCAYVQIPIERWGPASCDTLLWYVRGVYDAGYRPQLGRALIIPRTIEDIEDYANAARDRDR